MSQLNYLINTTTISTTASGTTIGSGNTQAAAYTLARTLTRPNVGAAELLGTSQTWSLRSVVSATSGLYAMRFKLQRKDAGGSLQTESSYFAEHNPVTVTTYDDNVTWASGTWAADDQLVLVWEHFRTSGTGNKSATLDANGASYITAPTAAGTPHTVDPADTLSLADARAATFGKGLADTFVLADARAAVFGKGVADTLALADARAHTFDLSRADTLALTDDVTPDLEGDTGNEPFPVAIEMVL